MQAYSEATGITYPDFDALVQAESHGYTVCAVITRDDNTWPWMVGLYLTKREARRATARLRAQWRRSVFPPTTYSVFVRPVWHAP